MKNQVAYTQARELVAEIERLLQTLKDRLDVFASDSMSNLASARRGKPS
jgi:hypothetical protein